LVSYPQIWILDSVAGVFAFEFDLGAQFKPLELRVNLNRISKALIAATIGTTALLVVDSSAHAHLRSSDPSRGNSTAGWFAVAPLTGDVFIPPNARSTSEVNPNLLQIDDWDKCWIQHVESWQIEAFTTRYLGARKRMSIQCGSADTHGYLHVALGKNAHQKGWRNRVKQAEPRENTDSWDDLMWFSAISTWTSPEVSVNKGSGKVCRSGPIQMFETRPNGSKVLKYTFRPTFIWSITANRLITAIETTVASC
jgi:hypothetical protein